MLPNFPGLVLLTTLSLFSTLAISQKCTGKLNSIPARTPSKLDHVTLYFKRHYAFINTIDLGQSCAIAALSGSTNESYEEITKAAGGSGKAPTGSNSKGKECITKYYKELGLKAPGGNLATPSKATGGDAKVRRSKSLEERVVEGLEESGGWDVIEVAQEGEKEKKKEKRADCKPNGLLFARGTTEMGTMGNTVGPALSRALGSSKWKVEGVKYTADIAGDDCIGFPGGIKCRDQLVEMSSACPETKWFVGGYSQGAMVARICTAFSKMDIQVKIKVSPLPFLRLFVHLVFGLMLGVYVGCCCFW